jgi:hypothetical protein
VNRIKARQFLGIHLPFKTELLYESPARKDSCFFGRDTERGLPVARLREYYEERPPSGLGSILMRIVQFAVIALLACPAGVAYGQQQPSQSGQTAVKQDPIVEAARQAQERKKDQAKAAKVWDNDNIPSKTGDVSVIGETPAPSADASAATDSTSAAPVQAKPVPTRAELESSVRDARKGLLTMKTDLDILQRTYDLDLQMYMSKPDYASDKEGAAKMADEKAQVDAKKQEIADLEKKIQEMQGKM